MRTIFAYVDHIIIYRVHYRKIAVDFAIDKIPRLKLFELLLINVTKILWSWLHL